METKVVEKIYNQLAHDYDQLVVKSGYCLPFWFPEKVSALNFPYSFRALDLACGNGLVGKLLQDSCIFPPELIGVDVSAAQLEVAKKRGNYKLCIKWDLSQGLPSLEENFDLVTSFGFFEFVKNADALLKDIKEKIIPGGHLLCAFEHLGELGPSYETQFKGDKFTHYTYSQNQVKEMLQAAGFQKVSIQEIHAYVSSESKRQIDYLMVHAKV